MSYALFQVQCQALGITLALAEREYLRYPPGTIIDGVNVGGQFATGKKSGSASQKETAIPPKSLMGDVTKALEKTFAQDKDLEAKIARTVAEISKNIVAQYPIDQKPLQLPGASFAQKLQAAAAQYLSAEAKLPIASPSEQKQLLGNMVKAAIPLAVALGLTVGVELAIGLLIGQTIGEAIVGSALVFGVSSATDKALDIAKVENPIVRASLQIVAGLATGGLVAKSIKATAMKAKNIAEVAEKLIKEATLTLGLRNKILDPHRMAKVLEENKIDSEKILDALYREVNRDKQIGRMSLHPFSKRLNEYVELVSENSKSNSVAIEWRKGIIDAEIKYGEKIDKIYDIALRDTFSSKTEVMHKEFLDAIKEGKKNNSNIQKIDQSFIDNYSHLFKGDFKFILEGRREYRGIQIDVKRRINEVTEAAAEAAHLANARLGDVFVGHIEGLANKSQDRAFARTYKSANLKYLSTGLAGDTRDVAFHETGHFIESTKGLAKYSVDLIENRTSKQRPFDIDGQKVASAGFISPYTGKIYNFPGLPNDSTEVISMGLEYLTSFQRLHRLAWADPDHLRFTLFALDTTGKK